MPGNELINTLNIWTSHSIVSQQDKSCEVPFPIIPLVPGDVLQGDGVLHSELVRLTLNPRLLDQHTRICSQA